MHERIRPHGAIRSLPESTPAWRGYLAGILITGGCTAIAAVMSVWFAPTNLAMVYLLGVVLAGARLDRRASVVAAVLGTLAFDFFFIPPLYSFAISDTQYLLTAVVLLTVGLVISSLSAGLRIQADVATDRERRTAALYAMTREFSVATSLDDIARCARAHIAQVFGAQAAILLKGADGAMFFVGGEPTGIASVDTSIADWVIAERTIAGFGTKTLPAIDALYLPLNATHGIVGVLIVHSENRASLLVAEHRHFLEIFANQIAVAVEREQLRQQAHDSAFAAQNERLRSSLLSSISHDLRTPLAVMSGGASSLLQGESALPTGPQRQMVEVIHQEAQRMTRVVNNILDMTRLESAPVRLDRQWYPLEEILGAVLAPLKDLLGPRSVCIDIPRDFPMLYVDGVLFEKVLMNLLENAAKYTPVGACIEVSAAIRAGEIRLVIMDDGPGIPQGMEKLVFEKFYRVQAEGAVAGAGLGLAICTSIVEAHGGLIWTESRTQGGAIFSMTLPSATPGDEFTQRQAE
jgi:two-component system sensor histidine kinase KdpD